MTPRGLLAKAESVLPPIPYELIAELIWGPFDEFLSGDMLLGSFDAPLLCFKAFIVFSLY